LSASVNDFSTVNSNIHIRNGISVAHIAKRTSVGNITTNSHKPSEHRSARFVKIRVIGDIKRI
jgi:hypothetical protein